MMQIKPVDLSTVGVKITISVLTDRETRLVQKSIILHDLEFKIQTGADTSVQTFLSGRLKKKTKDGLWTCS